MQQPSMGKWWLCSLGLGVVFGFAVACVDDGGGDCQAGTEGCECLGGTTCNGDLECNAGTCEAPGSSESAGDGDGDGDPTGDGDGDGDGDGEPTGDGDGDGDGEPTGDGDGDGDGEPTGDGDGEPTGDGDGEPTGDGDGEPTGDGDGDPLCGNGQLDGNEECDDGNTVDDAECSHLCLFPGQRIHENEWEFPPTLHGLRGVAAFEITPNHEFVVVYDWQSRGTPEAWVRRADDEFNELWSFERNEVGYSERTIDGVVDSEGNTYVTLYEDTGNIPFYLFKLDDAGQLAWDVPLPAGVRASALTIGPADAVRVSAPVVAEDQVSLLEFSPNGSLVDMGIFLPPDNKYARMVTRDDGTNYLFGTYPGTSWMAKVPNFNWPVQWLDQTPTPWLGEAAVTADGGVVASGYQNNALVKWTSDGDVAWSIELPDQQESGWPRAIAADDLGNIVVVGMVIVSQSVYHRWITKINPAGEVIWTDIEITDDALILEGVAIDEDGYIFVVGGSPGDDGLWFGKYTP